MRYFSIAITDVLGLIFFCMVGIQPAKTYQILMPAKICPYYGVIKAGKEICSLSHVMNQLFLAFLAASYSSSRVITFLVIYITLTLQIKGNVS